VQCQVLVHKPGQTSPAENKSTKRMDFFVLIVGSFVGWGVGTPTCSYVLVVHIHFAWLS